MKLFNYERMESNVFWKYYSQWQKSHALKEKHQWNMHWNEIFNIEEKEEKPFRLFLLHKNKRMMFVILCANLIATLLLLTGAIVRWRRAIHPSFARFSIGGITIFLTVNIILLLFFSGLIYFPQRVINYWDIDVCELWSSLGKIIFLSRLYSVVLTVFQDWGENDMCFGSSLLPAGTLDYGKIVSIDIFDLAAIFVIAIMPFSWKIFSLISLIKGIQLFLLLTTCSGLLHINELKLQSLIGIILTNFLYLLAMLILISTSLERNMKSFFHNIQQQEQSAKDKVKIVNMLCRDIKTSTNKTRQNFQALHNIFHPCHVDMKNYLYLVEKSSYFIDNIIDYLVLLYQMEENNSNYLLNDRIDFKESLKLSIEIAQISVDIVEIFTLVDVSNLLPGHDIYFRSDEKHFEALLFYSLVTAASFCNGIRADQLSLKIHVQEDKIVVEGNQISILVVKIVYEVNENVLFDMNEDLESHNTISCIICHKLAKFLNGKFHMDSKGISFYIEIEDFTFVDNKNDLHSGIEETLINYIENSAFICCKQEKQEIFCNIFQNVVDNNYNKQLNILCAEQIDCQSLSNYKIVMIDSILALQELRKHNFPGGIVIVSDGNVSEQENLLSSSCFSMLSPFTANDILSLRQWIIQNLPCTETPKPNLKLNWTSSGEKLVGVKEILKAKSTSVGHFSWHQTIICRHQYENYAKWRFLNPGSLWLHHSFEFQLFYILIVIVMVILYELQLLSLYSLIFFVVPPVFFLVLQRNYLYINESLPEKVRFSFSLCWNIHTIIILLVIGFRFASLFADVNLSSNLTDFANHIYNEIKYDHQTNATQQFTPALNVSINATTNDTQNNEFSVFLQTQYGVYTGADLIFSSANVISYTLFIVDTVPWPWSILTAICLFMRPLLVIFGYLFSMLSFEDFQYQIGGICVIGLLVIVAFHWYKEANYRREFREIYQLIVSKFFIDQSFLYSRQKIMTHLQNIQSIQLTALAAIQKQLLVQKSQFFITLDVLEELNSLQLQVLLYKQYTTRFQMQELSFFEQPKAVFIENMKATLLKLLVNQIFSTLLPVETCYSFKDSKINHERYFASNNGQAKDKVDSSYSPNLHDQESWVTLNGNIRMFVHIHPSLTLVRVDDELFSAMISQICQLILQHMHKQTIPRKVSHLPSKGNQQKNSPVLDAEEDQHHELLIWITPYSKNSSVQPKFMDIRAMSVTILSTIDLPFVKRKREETHAADNTIPKHEKSSVNTNDFPTNEDLWKDYDAPFIDTDDTGEWNHIDIKAFEEIEGIDIMCDKIVSFLQIQDYHSFGCGKVENHSMYKSFYKVCLPYISCTDSHRLGELFQHMEGMIDMIERPNIKYYTKYYRLMQSQMNLVNSVVAAPVELMENNIDLNDSDAASLASQRKATQQKNNKNKISILSLERGDLIREAYSLSQIWEKYSLEIQATYIIELPSPELFMSSDCVIIEYSRSSTYQTKELIHYLRGMQYYGNIVVAYNEDVQKQPDSKMKKLQNPNQYTDAVVADMHILLPLSDTHVENLADLCKARIYSMVICNKL